MAINDLPSLQVIRRCIAERKRANENLHNVAWAIFKLGKKVQFVVNEREYFGSVVSVCGMPGLTQLLVKNLRTLKERKIELFQVTGLVQEN